MENNLPEVVKLDDSEIDNVLEMIILGSHYKEIAAHYKCSVTTIFRYLSRKEFSARVREAKEFAAHNCVDEAERVLKMAYLERNKPGGMIAFNVAREMAFHLRWKASMINRTEYASRKVEVPVAPEEKEQDKLIIEILEDDGEARPD